MVSQTTLKPHKFVLGSLFMFLASRRPLKNRYILEVFNCILENTCQKMFPRYSIIEEFMAHHLTKKNPKTISLDLNFPIRSGIINFKFEREMRMELSKGLMKRFDDISEIRRIRIFLLNFSGFDLPPHSEPCLQCWEKFIFSRPMAIFIAEREIFSQGKSFEFYFDHIIAEINRVFSSSFRFVRMIKMSCVFFGGQIFFLSSF